MTRRHARCDIAQYSYDPPPKPNSCDFDWGTRRVGKMRCTSKRSGMRCLNRRTDYGFAISRDSYNTL